MAANREALNQQLQHIVNSLKQQGILDHQFMLVHSLKEANSPFFLAEIIPMFCQNIQTTITDFSGTLENEPVSFYNLQEIGMKLRGCTSSIGARRMALACVKLSQAIDNKDKAGCGLAFNCVKREFETLRRSLDRIVEVERRIVCHEL